MFHWKSLVNFRCFFTFNIPMYYLLQASLRLYSVCIKLMFDFTVCMLSNPAPPLFAVSKYASVTLPLKPVLCDKGCVLKRDWNAKFPWAPVPSVSRAIIRSPPPVICKSMVQHTLDQVTPGLTSPPQKHPCLSEPVETSSLREENVWITDWVFSRWWLYREGFLNFLCNNSKNVWFLLLYIS